MYSIQFVDKKHLFLNQNIGYLCQIFTFFFLTTWQSTAMEPTTLCVRRRAGFCVLATEGPRRELPLLPLPYLIFWLAKRGNRCLQYRQELG